MSFGAEIIARLGLNTTSFSNGLKQAGSNLQSWASDSSGEIRKVSAGVEGLKKLFVVGGLLTAARTFFQGAIEHARAYRGETDEGINATRRFADKLDELSVIGAKAGIAIVGWVEKAAVGLASIVYGTDAAADAFNKMNAAAESAMNDERAAKLAAAQERLAKATTDIAYAEQDNYGKLAILINQVNDLKDKQRSYDKDSAEYVDLQVKVEQNLAQQRKVNAQIRQQDIEAARVAEERTAGEIAAAEEARLARLDALRIKREALVQAAAEEAALAGKMDAIRNAPSGGGPNDVPASELDFEWKRDAQGNLVLDKNKNPIPDPDTIRPKRGGIGPGAKFDRGMMFAMGGEKTFQNPADQFIYEQTRRRDELDRIDRQIAALEEQIQAGYTRMAFGGLTRNYVLDDLRQAQYALQNRRSNIDGYLFDPKYSDALGRSVPGEQIAVRLGSLEDIEKETRDEIRGLRRLFEQGGARVRNTDETPRNPRG